jgi:hypothetical protein
VSLVSSLEHQDGVAQKYTVGYVFLLPILYSCFESGNEAEFTFANSSVIVELPKFVVQSYESSGESFVLAATDDASFHSQRGHVQEVHCHRFPSMKLYLVSLDGMCTQLCF